jgi:apolipoprotein N-acyltransferase
MFRSSLISLEPGIAWTTESHQRLDEAVAMGPRNLAALVKKLGTPVLVGIDRLHFLDNPAANTLPPYRAYNSAVLVGRDGKIVGTYDKMHRVMFGEYIPFADWFPFLYGLTPLTGGIVAGDAAAALWLDATYCFSPNICYETAIPHVIRRQVAALEKRSEYPVALVNLTNDAWYWGSSELDMHLACGVFRAVETRVPLVVAANGGLTASIDRVGRVREKCPRQEATFLIADIEPGYLPSWYVRLGDWFAGLCLAACLVLMTVEWRSRRTIRTVPPTPES